MIASIANNIKRSIINNFQSRDANGFPSQIRGPSEFIDYIPIVSTCRLITAIALPPIFFLEKIFFVLFYGPILYPLSRFASLFCGKDYFMNFINTTDTLIEISTLFMFRELNRKSLPRLIATTLLPLIGNLLVYWVDKNTNIYEVNPFTQKHKNTNITNINDLLEFIRRENNLTCINVYDLPWQNHPNSNQIKTTLIKTFNKLTEVATQKTISLHLLRIINLTMKDAGFKAYFNEQMSAGDEYCADNSLLRFNNIIAFENCLKAKNTAELLKLLRGCFAVHCAHITAIKWCKKKKCQEEVEVSLWLQCQLQAFGIEMPISKIEMRYGEYAQSISRPNKDETSPLEEAIKMLSEFDEFVKYLSTSSFSWEQALKKETNIERERSRILEEYESSIKALKGGDPKSRHNRAAYHFEEESFNDESFKIEHTMNAKLKELTENKTNELIKKYCKDIELEFIELKKRLDSKVLLFKTL